MSCARIHQMLDAYVDGELDASTAAELDQHVATCPACAALRADRQALSARIRAAAPYFRAPGQLRSELERMLRRAGPRLGRRPTWPLAGALAAAAAVAGLVAGVWFGRGPIADPRLEEVVASHVGSLAPDRKLVDVASSDRHVLKPWFAGRSDFAPSVRDLSAEGFELVGARLDHVGHHQAAAVVYRVRNHYVNLFMWRGPADAAEATRVATARGFAVATWSAGGVRFAAISDVDRRDLERFAQLASAP